MKLKISGTEDEIKAVIALLKTRYKTENSNLYDSGTDFRYNVMYVNIIDGDRVVKTTPEDYQIIELCNKSRSKNDVMNYFGLSFDAAAEILDRLAEEGTLYKYLEEKRYMYVDARYLRYVGRCCGHCKNRSYSWGECYAGVEPEDLEKRGDTVYIPVDHAACDKFQYSPFAVAEAVTKENYQKFAGGGE